MNWTEPVGGGERESQQKEARGGCSLPVGLRTDASPHIKGTSGKNLQRGEAPVRKSAFTSAKTAEAQQAHSRTCSRKTFPMVFAFTSPYPDPKGPNALLRVNRDKNWVGEGEA